MFVTSIECVTIYLLIAMCQGARGDRPEITPGDRELYLYEGDSLELTCTSTDDVEFYYPGNVSDTIATSPVILDKRDFGDKRGVVLRRTETIHGDTGWYGCAEGNVTVTQGDYDDSNVNWIYVYVQSNSSYFVQSDNFESFRKVLGSTVTIPCRPTSPDYDVVLLANDDTEIKMGDKASYDPRIGFELKNITLLDSGYFRCSIEAYDVMQEVNYHLNVMRIKHLTDPKIDNSTLRYVTRGQTLRVNCSADVDTDIAYHFNWTTPLMSNRITTRHYTSKLPGNKHTVTCELIINGVVDEDEGIYECTIKTFSDRKSAVTMVTIYNPDNKYINLEPEDDDRLYMKKYGDQVEWVVAVDAYPQPTLKWLSPNGDEISGSWLAPDQTKHAIKTSPSSTILRINRLNIHDMGLYTLQATNEDQIKIVNFTLEILAKPILILEDLEAFYMPQQTINVFCKIAAFPAPNVSWSFLEAPNYPSLNDSQVVLLNDSSTLQQFSTAFRSTVSARINASGYLTCTACNDLGCDSATERINLSDVPSGFGVIESSKELTEGDDVDLTCAASIYNYTNVEWLDGNDDPVQESEQVTITKGRTQFTHRSKLRLLNVDKTVNGSHYVCRAVDHDGSAERSDYVIRLYEPVAPYLLETNMNKTSITLDLKTQGHKTIIFKCYVEGTPSPNITWYKDDITIVSNEQYMCLHDNQELHVKYLLDGDSGRYTCKAVNRFGSAFNYQILVIKGKDISRALIMSIVALVTTCITLVIYFSIKMHREKVLRRRLMEAGLTHFEDGALECLNPELPVDDQAELLPYDRKWEFPRERLKFGKQLGFGAFGVVMKAEARGICDDEEVTTVAVKMVRQTTESTYIRALASELKIMVHLGKHLNVVNLLGACTKNILKRELLVIVEYCRYGNLHNYLMRHRADFIDQIDPSSGKLDPSIGLDVLAGATFISSDNSCVTYSRRNSVDTSRATHLTSDDPRSVSTAPDGCVSENDSTQPGWRSNYSGDYKDHNLKPICTQDLLSWAFQVARGMEYLSQRKVLHGDLAARNILLAEKNIVKICDFGLAKTMYKSDNYKKEGDAPLPIKWMAIESIRDRIFSTQSDIWSFGIVLWEFFTLAKTPYPGMEAEKQYQRLIAGYRMEQPEYATKDVYDIMLRCWKAKPTLRPTFTSLVASIGDLLEETVKEHYVDLNAPYLDMNTMDLETVKNDYLTMMIAPDYGALSSPSRDYINSPCTSTNERRDDSYLPMTQNDLDIVDKKKIDSDAKSEAVEMAPMLNGDSEIYLEPMTIHERRSEFMRQRMDSAIVDKIDETKKTDLNYCNTLPNVHLIDLNDGSSDDQKLKNLERRDKNILTSKTDNSSPMIIENDGVYVNVARQKNNLMKNGTSSFSNPSYIMISDRGIENARI